MKLLLGLLLSVSFLFSAVDINTASEKELTSLKGIGASKAKDIVNYRNENCFKSVDELVKIKGIGKKTIAKNLEDLTVSKCKK